MSAKNIDIQSAVKHVFMAISTKKKTFNVKHKIPPSFLHIFQCNKREPKLCKHIFLMMYNFFLVSGVINQILSIFGLYCKFVTLSRVSEYRNINFQPVITQLFLCGF